MAQIKNSIFNKKKLKYQIEKVNFNDIADFHIRMELVNKWLGFVNSESFYKSKETELQGNFLFDIFGKVLGYSSKLNNPTEWNLNQEQVTTVGGKFADGSLGFYDVQGEIIRVVIELKDPNTSLDERQHRHNDNRTPVEQAFGYQHRIGKDCKWVIVSNFNEIRLYHHSSSIEFEQFFIKELASEEKLRRFFFLLGKDNLIAKQGNSVIDSLFISNEQDEQEITKKFYAAFKDIRLKFFDHLKTNNPSIDENILLEKTQKLLDRFIFICFAEDNRLLPETVFKNMVKAAKISFSYSDTKVWNELKGLFNAINVGSPPHNINKFNGGLFAADDILDSLQIKDQILEELSSITEYDFESDVSIDILGHIFEQSISDLEEIKASINGEVFEKSKSKRKRDGIVYTPAYITKDIVEKAVGGWLEDRKKELGFYELSELTDEDFKTIVNNRGKITSNDKIKQHLEFWYAYRERLMNIKVLDPACGSGAFLIQVFDFLYIEGMRVNDIIARLLGGQYEVFQLDKHILSNNIYGVDINSESVEITKLSLWLKTANRNAELTSLDNNIKCGNSLIDDPEVAGDKAFNWEKEFPQVFKEKELKAWHITWVTYNSRVSDRMKTYQKVISKSRMNKGSNIELNKGQNINLNKGLQPLVPGGMVHSHSWLFDEEMEIEVTKHIKDIILDSKYIVPAFNICDDHIHLLLICEENEISNIVRKLKGKSSQKIKEYLNIDKDSEFHLWAQKFNTSYIENDEKLYNTIQYINNNRIKHDLPLNKGLQPLVQEMITPIEYAFKPQFTGGFDVVVGNPPYVNIANISEIYIREFLQTNYSTVKNKSDLYSIFIEKGYYLLKNNGYLCFIFPNSWLGTDSFSKFRDFLINNTKVIEMVKLPIDVFKDVTVTTIILAFQKEKVDNHNIILKELINNNFIKYDYSLDYERIKKTNSLTFSFAPNLEFQIENVKLGDIAQFSLGIKTSNDDRFILDNKIDEDCYLMLRGRDISRYYHRQPKEYIWYKPELMMEKVGAGPRKLEYFLKEKLLFQGITGGLLKSTFDNNNYLVNDKVHILYKLDSNFNMKFILALINSKYVQKWFNSTYNKVLEIKINQLLNIPIPTISLEDQLPFITLADKMLELNKELKEKENKFIELLKADFNIEKLNTKLENWYKLSWTDFINELKKLKIVLSGEMKEDWLERFNRYKTQINELQNIIQSTDKKIDQLVYELYGLTEEEIKVVEGE